MIKENKKEKKVNGNSIKILFTILIILLGAFGALIGYITDFLWFKELGYISVFFTKLSTQLKIGIPVFLVITIIAYIYFKLIKKGYYKKIASNDMGESKVSNIAAWILAAVFGLVVAVYTSTGMWFSTLQFANSSKFGYDDPLFGLDVSFYIFKLDFLHQVNGLLIVVLAVFIILSLAYYAVLMGTRNPRIFKEEYSSQTNPFEEEDRFSQNRTGGFNPDGTYSYSYGGGSYDETQQKQAEEDSWQSMFEGTPLEGVFKNFGKKKAKKPEPKKTVSVDNENIKKLFTIASKQLIFAGVALFLMIGAFFLLKQFDLLYTHGGVVYGAGFTDVTVTLWMYRILMALSFAGAIGVIVGVKKHRPKYIAVIPMIMVVVGCIGVGGAIAVQQLVVSPNEIARESKYLQYNIEYTQKAYGLDDITVKQFKASNDLTGEDIANNSETINNIRINDYQPAETFYNQTQSIRQYYTFNDVDVDRYVVNGEYTQTFLSAREIDEEKISQTWLNKHLKYTHGYGITLSRVDEVTANGQPKMLIKNIPPHSEAKEIEINRPEIYFGEKTNSYSIVGTDEDEFDYPNGDSNEYTRYEGSAGIKLNLLNRVMFAIKERNLNLLVSSNIDSNSKIIINRNIRQRVNKIMPYLQYEKDPYMIVENGKLYWMIDAYTTSNSFPYSESYEVDGRLINYVRNSVKVVVDAYNGDVKFYVVDETDPIAKTFQKIYPKLFKSSSEMPEAFRLHMRYPSELTETQAQVYSKYHMNDVRVFYQNEDLWEVSKEIYGTEEKTMEASYYIMKLPGEKNAEFVSSIPFTPKDKKNLTGLMVARSDGENYGELVIYKMPKSKVIYGPRQIEAQIDQDTEISKEFSLWNSSGSKYSRGNMFVIPIEDSLLYVEPVYLEASESSIPEVKRVIVAYGDEIAYEETLAEALNSLFGDEAAADDSDSDGDKDTGNKKDYIKKAQEAYENAINAQKEGDWAAYGKYMDQLEKYLDKLN